MDERTSIPLRSAQLCLDCSAITSTVWATCTCSSRALVSLATFFNRTPLEHEAQRRSFSFGNCNIGNPDVTYEVVTKAAEDLEREAQMPETFDERNADEPGRAL